MMTFVNTTTQKSGPMTIVSHTFNTGVLWSGKMIQIRETFSTLAGRTLHSWDVMLKGSCCWIGTFNTARKALDFYTKCPVE
jgi:hypothetical protein